MKKDSIVSVLLKIGRYIVNSAAIALLITLVIFVYQEIEEQKRADETINNLEDISNNLLDVHNSLTTRYLGIFPDFIPSINDQMRDLEIKDSIVIFEDVLYYGFLSKPRDFRLFNHTLLSHSDNGGKVSVVYYDINGRTFHRMVQEQRIHKSFFSALDLERREFFKNAIFEKKVDAKSFSNLDTLLSKKYFERTKNEHKEEFNRDCQRYLRKLHRDKHKERDLAEDSLQFYQPTDSLYAELEDMYIRIDSIKTHYLKKPREEIDFYDYERMYRDISKEMIDTYLNHGVEMIAIDENLTMSCWLVNDHAVLAFPSKYASDEIGFYSRDPAFSKYIGTLLSGLRGYYGNQ